jgi:tetratricopeptide (TPR) repeat protein
MPRRYQYFNCFSRSNRRSAWWIAPLLAFALLPLRLTWADDRTGLAAEDSASSASMDSETGDTAGSVQRATNEKIKALIRQLGHPRFTIRRSAASELRQIGAEAFDLLNSASNDSDPEVAASARYLLREITVRWVHSGDSAAVRALLRDYGQQRDELRVARLEGLAKLPNSEGVAALCRIARFDRSPLVSRQAALAIIRPDERSSQRTPIDAEVVSQELGTSTRAASMWLRQYLVQLRDPAASVAPWQQLVDEETKQLEANADDTSTEVVLVLLWNLADLHRELDHQQDLVDTVDRMMELDSVASEDMAVQLLSWLTEHESWKALDEFLTKHQPRLQQSKRPLYYAALARAKQGKSELGEELAQKAADLDPQAALESFIAAKDLEEHSQFDWAVREYRRTIDKEPVSSHGAILARVYLANLLHDYERHEQAADVLDPLVKAVQGESRVGQLYAKLHDYYAGRLSLPETEGLAARLHYFRACQYRDHQDWQRMRDELELAIRFDPTDADVVIAMYRLPEADEKWREATRRRIANLARQFKQEIDENPSDPTAYNQWAWLISNTEGDYSQAIAYSHRSLELIPEGVGESAGASFLDTLGRCYYAAGDYENAVKYQRQAVKKVDYMQVMQRQLALFEKTFVEQSTKRDANSSTN